MEERGRGKGNVRKGDERRGEGRVHLAGRKPLINANVTNF